MTALSPTDTCPFRSSVAQLEPDNLRQHSVRSGLVTLGNQAVKFGLRLFGTMVLARLLTPADFGVVAMVGSLVGFVAMLREFGLSMAIVQRPALAAAELNAVFWVNLLLGLLVSAGLAAAAPAVAAFYGRPETIGITWAFAGMGLIGCLGTQHYALLQRQMRFGAIAVRDLLAATVGLAAGIWAAAAGMGFWALVIMEAVGTAAGTAFLWWRSGWLPGRPRTAPGLRPLLRFGGAMTVSNLLGYANHNLDNILLGRFLGDVAVGFYSRAQALLNRPLEQVLPPVMSVALPTLSRVVADPPRFRRATLRLVEMVCFGGCFLSMVLIPSADWVVMLILGPQWMEAVPVFRVLSVFGLLEPLAWLLGLILVAYGRPEAMARWRALTLVVVAGAFVAGMPWGILGVATGYMLSGVVTRLWLVFFVGRRVGLPARAIFAAGAPFVLTAGGAATGLWLLRDAWTPSHPVWGLAALLSAAAVLYTLSLMCFSRGRRFLSELLRLVRETMAGAGGTS
jgi:PST family polysaccharide transporter